MTSQRASTVLIWAARVAWVGALALGPTALDHSTTRVAIAASVTVWLVGLGCLVVPSTATLALGRVVFPFAIVSVVLIGSASLWTPEAIGTLICVSVTAAAIWSGDVGDAFVQASAYGDEDRFLLRAPRVYLLIGIVNWTMATAAGLAGGVRLAAGQWAVGGLLAALGAAAFAFGWPRWYRMAQRWLVLVPAGLVFHDQVLLADTTMWRRDQIRSVAAAPHGSGSFDLTGSAWGQAVQIDTVESETVVLAARPSAPAGTGIHLTSVRVTPTRPGRFIRSAAARGIAVGNPTTSRT